MTVKSTGCVFNLHSRKWNIYLHLYIHFFALVSRQSELRRHWVPPVNTQCLQNSAESGERSILTLGSLCLPCCVRDIAWSWFNFLIFTNKIYDAVICTWGVECQKAVKTSLGFKYTRTFTQFSAQLRRRGLLYFYIKLSVTTVN